MIVNRVESSLREANPDLIQAGECMGEIRVDAKLVDAIDEGIARRGGMANADVRQATVSALIDTGAVRVWIPLQLVEQLGLEMSGRTIAIYADGRKENVGVTEPIRVEIEGRSTVQYALVLGDEVLIGQLALEDTDLWADCKGRRLVPNPAHPDQPVFPSQVTQQPLEFKLAVLISGSGRTLKNFIDLAAEGELPIDIRLVVSSNAQAGGLKFANEAGIRTVVVSRGKFPAGAAGDQQFGDAIFSGCREAGVDYVAMAGFLKLAPVPEDFAGRVVNIHPSLIPAFCGPGMYGDRVHQAVLDAGVKVTGCTVQFVDNVYDHGPIIWQQPVPVFDDDTADTLGKRVFEVEKEAYPHVLKLLAAARVKLDGRRVSILKVRRSERSTGSAYPVE